MLWLTGVLVEKNAVVAGNRIQARKAAVIASAGMTFFPEDLTRPGAKNYPRATIRDNQAS